MRKSDELKKERKRFVVWLAAASFMHAVMLASLVMFQLYYSRTHPPMKIVNVSLVSLSEPGGPGSATSPSESQDIAVSSPEEQPAKQDTESVSGKKAQEPLQQPEPQKQVKSVAVDPDKQKQQKLSDALEKIRKNVGQQKPSGNLKDALAQLQKKVATQGSGSSASGGGSAGGGNLYGRGGGAFDPYKAQIAGIIQDNWAFSSRMLRSTSGMEVYVAINILPDGTIRQIKYDRKAPSEYLNNSVKVALEKSDPLPALPGEYGARDIWIGFVFTPEGIEH
jgi:colicin import membrane protein